MANSTTGTADFLKDKWTLSKDYLQGIKTETLKGLFDDSTKKDIYKLVLKKEWTTDSKENFEEKGIQGALGLVKATWKGKEGWEIKEEKINETNKVWLIIAQGKNAMYLMPVVRAAGLHCSEGGLEGGEGVGEAEKQIRESGVTDIKSWNFDKSEKWDEIQNTRLKEKMGSEFSITRTAETAILEGREGGATWRGSEPVKFTWNGKKKERNYSITKDGGINFLYKNAGELKLGNSNLDKSLYCSRRETYFPLDLVILGKATKEKELRIEISEEKHKMHIKDEIKEVIGVELNEIYLPSRIEIF